MSTVLELLRGWKTVIVKVAALLVGLLITYGVLSPADFAGIKDAADAASANVTTGVGVSAMALIALVLRLFTTTPMGQKS